jgi:hypothetical protein
MSSSEQLTIFDAMPDDENRRVLGRNWEVRAGLLRHGFPVLDPDKIPPAPGESIAPVCLTGPGLTVRSDGLVGE